MIEALRAALEGWDKGEEREHITPPHHWVLAEAVRAFLAHAAPKDLPPGYLVREEFEHVSGPVSRPVYRPMAVLGGVYSSRAEAVAACRAHREAILTGTPPEHLAR